MIRPGSMLFADNTEEGHITIEDEVEIGAGIHIYVNNHRFDRVDIPIKYQGYTLSQPVRIARGAWLGARVTLLPGVTIGENAVVGAGSVVTHDVPPRTVAIGVPARVIRSIGEAATP